MIYEIFEQALSRSGRVLVEGRQSLRGQGHAEEREGQGVCALESKAVG